MRRFLGYQTFDRNINQSSQPYDLLPEINIRKRWDEIFGDNKERLFAL